MLMKIADELLAREVLDADQVIRLAQGHPLAEHVPAATAPAAVDDAPRRETPERSSLMPQMNKPVGQE